MSVDIEKLKHIVSRPGSSWTPRWGASEFENASGGFLDQLREEIAEVLNAAPALIAHIQELEAEVERLRFQIAERDECQSDIEKDWHNINAYLQKAVGPNTAHSSYEMVDLLVSRIAQAKTLWAAEELERMADRAIGLSREERHQALSVAALLRRAAELRKELK